MVAETASWVLTCLLRMVLFSVRLYQDFIVFHLDYTAPMKALFAHGQLPNYCWCRVCARDVLFHHLADATPPPISKSFIECSFLFCTWQMQTKDLDMTRGWLEKRRQCNCWNGTHWLSSSGKIITSSAPAKRNTSDSGRHREKEILMIFVFQWIVSRAFLMKENI